MHSNRNTIMELPDSTARFPLVLAYSVKIEPGGQWTVPLECTRKITDKMDIRIDAGFHHRNSNVHIPPSCVNNPGMHLTQNTFLLLFLALVEYIIYILVEILFLLLHMSQQWMCTIWSLPVMTRSRSTSLNQGTGYHSIMKHFQKYQVTLLLSVHLQMYQVTERSISRSRKSQ